jgi:UDP-N-acetylglucosamine--N-acetylmuramyl-(pentapeptide) pyrophosphoryl-undecaprenol N-acetylglucosamine transferase
MKDRIRIVFSGGGTGGHLFPGLAAAEQLIEQLPHARITFAGGGKPMERREVEKASFDYLALPCRSVPSSAREAFSFVLKNLAGYLAARRFIKEEDVATVVGLGGYASVPMGWAASRFGVPLVLLEQNAVPGRATRWLARSADAICLAMPQAQAALHCRCPVYLTGNPVASNPCATASVDAVAHRRQLLVLGGSGGARSLNEHVPQALHQVREQLAGWQIVHQTGEPGLAPTRELYQKLALPATVTDFIADMPTVLAATALAVCRAGGTTLAELAAAGVPAVLVPYPHATDDHQLHNAEVYATAGGAVTLDERGLPRRLDHRLAETISALLTDSNRRARMSLAMRRLARPDAAARVALLIRSIACRGRLVAAPAA